MKILHLNIRRDEHLEKIQNLILEEKPDIVCLCEVFENDAEDIAHTHGYEYVFSPLCQKPDGRIEGQAIFSNIKRVSSKDYWYVGNDVDNIPVSDGGLTPEGKRQPERWDFHYSLLTAKFETEEGKTFTVGTTHFPVVDHVSKEEDGYTRGVINDMDDVNRAEVAFGRLREIIRNIQGSFIFTADLNHPRGEGDYDDFAHELVDLVPEDLASSLDPVLHRAKGLELMVDVFMITPDINGEKVKVIEGVSDHKAFVGNISC